MIERSLVELGDVSLETFRADGTPLVCAAHPATAFGAETAGLLAETARAGAICVNPRGLGASSPAASGGAATLEQMVDDLEAARVALRLDPWLFWGMSGGGWLAQIYAHRHPAGLTGIIVESACACFRERLADPTCAASPFFPAWRDGLRAAGLLDERSHTEPSPGEGGEWVEVAGVGQVFRRRGGPALLVSPMTSPPEMLRAMPVLWGFDARGWLGSLRTPALVIAGSADPIVPVARARAVHEALPGSRWLLVEGAGHVPTAGGYPEIGAAVRDFAGSLVALRDGRVGERRELEALQLRASLVWEEYREALLAHPDAIELPDEQLRDGRVRVAVAGGRVIGFSVVLPSGDGTAELDGLFVEPDRMKGGVGRRLIDDAVAAARARGVRRLDVVGNPRAREFYEKVGFVSDGEFQTRFGPGIRMRRVIEGPGQS